MEVMLEEYNQRNPDRAFSMAEFKTHLLEVYDKQASLKLKKVVSPDCESVSK